MSITCYQRKYEYYRNWYSEMTKEERHSIVGEWVFKNCLLFCTLIQEMEKQTAMQKIGINLN